MRRESNGNLVRMADDEQHADQEERRAAVIPAREAMSLITAEPSEDEADRDPDDEGDDSKS